MAVFPGVCGLPEMAALGRGVLYDPMSSFTFDKRIDISGCRLPAVVNLSHSASSQLALLYIAISIHTLKTLLSR